MDGLDNKYLYIILLFCILLLIVLYILFNNNRKIVKENFDTLETTPYLISFISLCYCITISLFILAVGLYISQNKDITKVTEVFTMMPNTNNKNISTFNSIDTDKINRDKLLKECFKFEKYHPENCFKQIDQQIRGT
jgi:hypothetical protein